MRSSYKGTREKRDDEEREKLRDFRCRKRWFEGFPMRKRLVLSESGIRTSGCAVKRELHQLLYTQFSPNPNLALWSGSKKRSTRRGGFGFKWWVHSSILLMGLTWVCWQRWRRGWGKRGGVERVVEVRQTPVEVGEKERGESVLLKFKFGKLIWKEKWAHGLPAWIDEVSNA